MAIDFPNSPSPGTNHTVDGKTWTFTDGKWALNVGVGGVQGPTGATGITGATGPTGITGATGPTGATGTVSLDSPTFTGTPTLPTGTIATTQTAGNNSTAVATTAFVSTAVANLVDSAPTTLNTLDELAAALGDDANFATTTATAIGLKAPLASPALTGTPTAPTAAVGTNTTQIATTEFVQVANPTGAVIAFAGSSAPSGWLLCFGQTVSRTTYATLFAVLSTTYGVGDGTTTFNLPDLRGRTVAGIDNMGGTDAGRLDIANSSGVVVGSQYVTLTSAQSGLPAHSHGSTASFSGSFTGTAASHNHTQDAHNHTQNAHQHVMNYADNGSIGSTRSVLNAAQTTGTDTGEMAPTTATNIATTATNQSTSITPAGSISGTVTMTNPNNTAANAASAVSLMQPTMVLNYIIKA